jgi:hypothetical protein
VTRNLEKKEEETPDQEMEAGKSCDMAAVIFFFLVISGTVGDPPQFSRVGQTLLRLGFFFLLSSSFSIADNRARLNLKMGRVPPFHPARSATAPTCYSSPCPFLIEYVSCTY